MTASVPFDVAPIEIAAGRSAETVRWPLAYRIQPPKEKQQSLQMYGFESHRPAPKQWWSHKLYRGPENQEVEIFYSRTKAHSEILARQFLGEPVVGFDMEWPWNDWKRQTLQNKIGLIQVAVENKIALFHIGLHPGETTDDIIAPSLRQLIESPVISKLGVGVLNADFSRLKRFFGIDPKGAFELSHLYRLVKFGGRKPDLISTKLASLADQVQDQLGHPLWKGDVRTSDWSKPLSQEQIKYAAGDAYAGFMLYHCMNFKRLQMRPSPPSPIHAEKYLSFKLCGITPLQLVLSPSDVPTTTSEEFFGVEMGKRMAAKGKVQIQKPQPAKPTVPGDPLDPISQALYEELVLRRATLATNTAIPTYKTVSDTALRGLARMRPTDTNSMLLIKGIGKVTQEKYGDALLEVIALFVAVNNLDTPAKAPDNPSLKTANEQPEHPTVQPPSTPHRAQTRGQPAQQDSTNLSPAFDTPPIRTPQLHTGLSFTMAETNLDTKGNESDDTSTSHDSNDSVPSRTVGSPSRRISSQLKRKRSHSSPHKSIQTASQRLQQLTQPDTNNKNAHDAPFFLPAPQTDKSTTQPAQERPLTPRSKIARNKLLAFSKLITHKLAAPRPSNAPPIVEVHTLDLLVKMAPRTQEELERIPGIKELLLACEQTGMCLLRNVVKFARVSE